MVVCPKCGFAGEDLDTCERCGIIYARMHTVFDASAVAPGGPAGSRTETGPTVRPGPRRQVPDASEAPTVQINLPAAMPAINGPTRAPSATGLPQAPGGATAPSPEREITLGPGIAKAQAAEAPVKLPAVPIIAPPARAPSRVPLLLLVGAVLCGGAWGIVKWRESRQAAESAEAAEVEDSDYFDLAVGSLVQDAQTQFRHISNPPVASRVAYTEMFERERRLQVQLTSAPMSDAHRNALLAAMNDVVSFLRTQVEPALRAAEGTPAATAVAPDTRDGTGTAPVAAPEPKKPEPAQVAQKIDQSMLKQANKVLASLPQ
jgi:hypothetical protein